MVLFPVMILIAWIVIIGLNVVINIPVYNFEIWYICVAVIGSTIAVIAIDGLTAAIVRWMPNKWFNPFAKCFKVYKWEKRFYENIGIKKWKDLVPELGHFTKFRKNKIVDPNNNEYISRFLLEIVYGRVGHVASFFTGFLIIFIFPLKYAMCFGFPVAIVNIIMNYMSVAILRYNTPKLIVLYKHNKRKELRKQESKIDGVC